MRAEIFLLSRNVKIKGDTSDPNKGTGWGCQIATADYEFDDGSRYGHMLLDNVEIYNCSQ